MLIERADEVIAGIASIQQHDTPGRDLWQQGFQFFALIGLHDRLNTSGNGELSEDIVNGGDQTFRIMALARLIKPAGRIKRLA